MTPAQKKVLHAASVGRKVFRSAHKACRATKDAIFAPKRTIDALVRAGVFGHAEGFNEYEPTNDALDVFVKMRKDWSHEAPN